MPNIDLSPEDKAEIVSRISIGPSPFLVPDVAPFGVSKTLVWHFLRDLVDQGALTHENDGYRKLT